MSELNAAPVVATLSPSQPRAASQPQSQPQSLPILPGAWLGMLGGGQLGRMFCFAAQSLGYRVAVLDPDESSPAGAVADRHLRAAYDDPAALSELAGFCAAVTTEFENVPAASLDWLAQTVVVSPSGRAVAVAQDRIAEKRFLADCVGVAPYQVIESVDDPVLQDDVALFPLLPGIVKTARLGYDGKGQVSVTTAEQVRRAFLSFDGAPCILEKRLSLAFEVSALVARGFDGSTVVYPIAQNVHRDGILAETVVPAPSLDLDLSIRIREEARTIATALDYVGVLCVEFFVLTDGTLVANEMAPRPHNSGHYTIDACATSQFEQQVRAMTGLPFGDTRQHSAAVMLNLLGDAWFVSAQAADDDSDARADSGATATAGIAVDSAAAAPDALDDALDEEPRAVTPVWDQVLAMPETRLHLYGKLEARPGRKMGHLTFTAPDRDRAKEASRQAAALLHIPLG